MTDLAPAPVMSDDEVIAVLSSSLYPGAKPASVRLVLNYCKAARLDPLQKPVHIVPMRVKTGEKNQWGEDAHEMRDTVMPGIGLYRTQAARTGLYAGQDAPVYGPMMTMQYKRNITEWRAQPGSDRKKKFVETVDEVIEFPEYIEVTIYKLVHSIRVAFTAQEFWIENYATSGGRESKAPNEVWSRRTRGQLKKCAEAQALRMAFPEAVGANPTAEEMEGRYVDVIENEPETDGEDATKKTKPARKSDRAEAPATPPAEPPAQAPASDASVGNAEPDGRPEPPDETAGTQTNMRGASAAETQANVDANAPKTDVDKAARLAEAARVAEKVGAPLKTAAEAPPPAAASPAAPAQAPAQQTSNGIGSDDDGVLAGKGERSYLYKRTVGRGMDVTASLSEEGFTNVKVGTEKEPFTGLTESQFNRLVNKHIKA